MAFKTGLAGEHSGWKINKLSDRFTSWRKNIQDVVLKLKKTSGNDHKNSFEPRRRKERETTKFEE